MAQDSDVARMAAALRTPSLRYRSFGNEPVRNNAPRAPAPAAEDFPLLGEALAAIESLPPETVIAAPVDVDATLRPGTPSIAPEPVPAPAPVGTPVAPAASVAPQVVEPPPPPPVEPAPVPAVILPAAPPVPPAPPIAVPVAAPPRPVLSTPLVPTPVVPRSAPAPGVPAGTPSLLQTLLAEAPPRPTTPAAAPIVVGRHPPQAPVAPPRSATGASEPILPSAPPASARGTPPIPPPPEPRDALGWTGGRRQGPGSGSSLLDTLVGRGDPSQSAAHYPLLDALTAAMRSDLSGASSRVWPAARVEMALPELLRRVAAGVRTGRGLV